MMNSLCLGFLPRGDVDGHLGQPGELGGFKAHITPQNNEVGVYYNGTCFEHLGELPEALDKFVELVLADGPRVIRIRPELVDRGTWSAALSTFLSVSRMW
jgi:hypothetical protein